MFSNQTVATVLMLTAFFLMAYILFKFKTVLLGYTLFSFINITIGSFSGYLFGMVFNLNDNWVDDSHAWVFTYSALGLIAYALGVLIAWQPLLKVERASQDASSTPSWLNEPLIIFCMVLGSVGSFLLPYTYSLATISSIVTATSQFLGISVLIALTYGKVKKNYRFFAISLLLFVAFTAYRASTVGYIEAGGLFIAQTMLVYCVWGGRLNPKNIVLLLVGSTMLLSLFVGWLDSRYLVRRGVLDSYTGVGRSLAFFQRFQFENPLDMPAATIQDYIFKRLDMSAILSAQANYQPKYEPYAYGGTVVDVLAALVPRFIWPDKPVRLGGNDFVSQYSGLTWSSDVSVGLQYPFELYANGGGIAVMLGLFVIGWLSARLEMMLFLSKRSLPLLLGVFGLVSVLTHGSQTFSTLIMTAGAFFIVAVGVGKLLELTNVSPDTKIERATRFGKVRTSALQPLVPKNRNQQAPMPIAPLTPRARPAAGPLVAPTRALAPMPFVQAKAGANAPLRQPLINNRGPLTQPVLNNGASILNNRLPVIQPRLGAEAPLMRANNARPAPAPLPKNAVWTPLKQPKPAERTPRRPILAQPLNPAPSIAQKVVASTTELTDNDSGKRSIFGRAELRASTVV